MSFHAVLKGGYGEFSPGEIQPRTRRFDFPPFETPEEHGRSDVEGDVTPTVLLIQQVRKVMGDDLSTSTPRD